MNIIIILLLQVFAFTVSPVAPAPVAQPVSGQKDYCRIYGSVYLERDPKYKNTAAYTVYIEKEDAFANMIVYRESNKLFADATAVWYITPKKAFADHVLYVTENRNLAQFSVYFTDARAFAECRQ